MDFPDTITLNGFTGTWRVWNGEYLKTTEIFEGAPVYRLEGYNYLNLIPITGIKILKYQGVWVLWKDGETFYRAEKLGEYQDYPMCSDGGCARWSDDGIVSAK